jgi:hypothetical protein
MKTFDLSSTDSIVNQVTIRNTCIHCNQTNEIILDAVALANWRNKELIQNAFPNLDYKQRELIQTGIHPECWDEMFPEEE